MITWQYVWDNMSEKMADNLAENMADNMADNMAVKMADWKEDSEDCTRQQLICLSTLVFYNQVLCSNKM